MIYFLQHLEDHFIKIGTTVNLRTRLAQLREEYGEQLQLLGVMDGTRDTERRLHLQFDHLRRFSEWFRPGPELLAYIDTHARPFPMTTPSRKAIHLQAYEKQQSARRFYYAHPHGLSDSELAAMLDVSHQTAYRYRQQLQAVKVQPGRYTLVPSHKEITEALTLLKVAISSSLISPHTILHTLSPANP